ncbi:hypothetical protein HON22_03330 [Candidatus Peregrinibacteria bacterium]|jgi:hypothetical protein|nr:hypothetical protein [Candidatus Peregrinibacteria bacterium]
MLIGGAISDYDHIKSGKWSQMRNIVYELEVKNEKIYNNIVSVGATQNFHFYYHQESQQTLIVPTNEIKILTVQY